MKIWVLSDLHSTRLEEPLLAPAEANLVIVAGDVADGIQASIDYLTRLVDRAPVLWILGNHEFFGEELPRARREAMDAASKTPGLHLLDDSAMELAGVRFLGATLWTDYRLYADLDENMRRAAMRSASSLPDHSQIWVEPPRPGVISRYFSPKHASGLHEASRAWLGDELGRPHRGPTVVITHHAPHRASVAAAFEGNLLTPAYVSDLTTLIEDRGPGLWVHGHTHVSLDYIVRRQDGGSTRVVCNPRGRKDAENPAFDAGLLVDLT